VADIQAEIARLQRSGVGGLFNFGSTQDMKDSSRVIGGADQGGLGCRIATITPKPDDKSNEIRGQYQDHIAKMLALVGDDAPKAAAEAKTIMGLEPSWPKLPSRTSSGATPKDLSQDEPSRASDLTPNWSWDTYFQEIGYTNI